MGGSGEDISRPCLVLEDEADAGSLPLPFVWILAAARPARANDAGDGGTGGFAIGPETVLARFRVSSTGGSSMSRDDW